MSARTVANIETLLTRKGWKQVHLSEASGIQPPNLSRMLKEGAPTSLDSLGRVADALGVSLGELVGVLPLPHFGKVSCGLPLQLPDGDIQPERWVALADLFGPSEGLFLLTATGDSMIDAHIAPGDLLIVRSRSAARSGQKVLAEVDGAVTVKVLAFQGRKYVLLACNAGHPPIVLDGKDDPRIRGVVVGVIRKEKV